MNTHETNPRILFSWSRCFAILAVTLLAASPKTAVPGQKAQSGAAKMQFESPKTRALSESATQRELTQLGANASWKLLAAKAAELGFRTMMDGGRIEAIAKSGEGKAVAAEIEVFPYAKEGSADAAALINVSDGKQKYHALLIAKNGDFQNAMEFTVKGNEVVKAHSWWRCVVTKLKDDCGTVCGAALATCASKDWKTYLFCLAQKCGECLVPKMIECIGK